MSQLKKGVVLSYLNIGVVNVIGLFLTPFIIHSLGDSEYGLYTLIGSFIAYLSLMDLGLNNTIIRFVAKYRADADEKGERVFLGNVFTIYLFISVIIVAIGTVLYHNLEHIFANSLTPEEIGKAKVMFVILIFNMAIVLPGGGFTALCTAYESFVWPRMLAIIKYISRAAIIVAVLSGGGGAIALVIIDTALNIVVMSITFWFVMRKLKVKFDFKKIEIPLFKTIFNYSIWIFLLATSSQFLWNAGQIILGIETDTTTVAYYAVGIMLGGYYGAFSGAISGVFLPRATQMSSNNSKEDQLAMMIRVGRILMIVLFLILTGFIIFGKEFVTFWVGDNYISSYYVAVIIMIAFTVPLLLSFASSLVEAYNKVKYKVIVYLVFFSLGLVFGYFLVPAYKEIGMIIGVTTGWMLAQIVMLFFYHKTLELNMFVFFKETCSKILLPVLILFLLAWFINSKLPSSLLYLIIKIGVYGSAYVVLMYSYSMNTYEKALFRRK